MTLGTLAEIGHTRTCRAGCFGSKAVMSGRGMLLAVRVISTHVLYSARPLTLHMQSYYDDFRTSIECTDISAENWVESYRQTISPLASKPLGDTFHVKDTRSLPHCNKKGGHQIRVRFVSLCSASTSISVRDDQHWLPPVCLTNRASSAIR